MTAKEMTEKQNANLYEKILTAARELFLEHGYDKMSMRNLARMIGYSPTTIYLYFKNKNDLFKKLAEEIFSDYLDRFSAVKKEVKDPEATLRSMFKAYVDLGLDNPAAYKLGFMVKPDVWAADGAQGQEPGSAQELYRLMRDCIRTCFKGDLADLDVKTQAAWTILHGLVSLLLTYPSFPWAKVEELKERTVNSAMMCIS